jgi:hypothetical protein
VARRRPEILDHFAVFDLLEAATRYYIGRRTIAGTCHARSLADAWPLLPKATREIVFKDVDRAREDGNLGATVDREAWMEIWRLGSMERMEKMKREEDEA